MVSKEEQKREHQFRGHVQAFSKLILLDSLSLIGPNIH
jgi:hypothetical protein